MTSLRVVGARQMVAATGRERSVIGAGEPGAAFHGALDAANRRLQPQLTDTAYAAADDAVSPDQAEVWRAGSVSPRVEFNPDRDHAQLRDMDRRSGVGAALIEAAPSRPEIRERPFPVTAAGPRREPGRTASETAGSSTTAAPDPTTGQPARDDRTDVGAVLVVAGLQAPQTPISARPAPQPPPVSNQAFWPKVSRAPANRSGASLAIRSGPLSPGYGAVAPAAGKGERVDAAIPLSFEGGSSPPPQGAASGQFRPVTFHAAAAAGNAARSMPPPEISLSASDTPAAEPASGAGKHSPSPSTQPHGGQFDTGASAVQRRVLPAAVPDRVVGVAYPEDRVAVSAQPEPAASLSSSTSPRVMAPLQDAAAGGLAAPVSVLPAASPGPTDLAPTSGDVSRDHLPSAPAGDTAITTLPNAATTDFPKLALPTGSGTAQSVGQWLADGDTATRGGALSTAPATASTIAPGTADHRDGGAPDTSVSARDTVSFGISVAAADTSDTETRHAAVGPAPARGAAATTVSRIHAFALAKEGGSDASVLPLTAAKDAAPPTQTTLPPLDPAAIERLPVDGDVPMLGFRLDRDADRSVRDGPSAKEVFNVVSGALTAAAGPPFPAAAVSAPTPSFEPAEGLPASIAALMHRISAQFAAGNCDVVLHLHPAELGDVSVRVTVSGRDVSAWFNSAQPHVEQAIGGSIGHLQSSLASAGYNLSGAWVGGDAWTSDGRGNGHWIPRTRSARAAASDDAAGQPSLPLHRPNDAVLGVSIYV